jgi:hydrogenase expression/formation protein HypC
VCLAVPGKVIERYCENGLEMARVDFGGVKRTVCMRCVPQAKEGDYVLVHVGFAIGVIDEQEAALTLQVLEEAGMLEAELEQVST